MSELIQGYEKIRGYLQKDMQDCKEENDYYDKRSKSNKHTNFEKLVFASLATINARAAFHNQLFLMVLTELKNTDEIMAQLPRTPEFDALKREIEETRSKALNTLLPLKELADKLKAAEDQHKRGDAVYG